MTRPARQATSLSRRNRIMNPIQRVGVVNWDCALPSTTFFGGYATKSLGEPKFRDRTPYYALDLDDGKIDFPERTQEAYDREMQYAIDAGIDYFAYCWYDRVPHQDHVDTSAAITVDAHVCELVGARMRHLQSPLRDALHLCAILINNHPYRDEELQDLAETMKEKCYEKIQGRPLAFFYTAPWDDVQGRLRTFCREAGVPAPFFVLMTPDAPPPPGLPIPSPGARIPQTPAPPRPHRTNSWRRQSPSRIGCRKIPAPPACSMSWPLPGTNSRRGPGFAPPRTPRRA